MRALFLILALFAAAGGGWGQRHKLGEVNAETPEGQLLQQIGQEADAAKRLALLEEFTAKHPKHEAAGWVYEQLQSGYLKANQHEKVMEIGDKLLAVDPEHVEAAHQSLKAAEALKNPDLIRKWAGVTSQSARKVAASAQPKDEEEAEEWKRRVDYAKQVNTYSDYSLYANALQNADPRKRLELIDALEQQNPQSEYLPQLVHPRFLAYRQAGDNAAAVAFAEKVLATDQSSEDMLLLVADNYLQSKKDPDKVYAYTGKMVEVMSAKPKPEGVSDQDWNKRKDQIIGLARFMAGKQYYLQNKFAAADKELRPALPLLDNLMVKAEALFYLGVSNFRMEKIQDAADFSKQCAALNSPFKAAALRNLKVIQSQYRGVK
ncbi:MAG: hypothetical protein FJW37_11210 [Acidobacteria bacterium]|nr:hypothetical protein [Acidobacteriota bacterium]